MAKELLANDADDDSDATDGAEGEGIEQDQYLVFTARDQEFGIQAMRIREISAMVDITTVPRAPAYIEGILNLRGRLVSVINFRRKFGFETKLVDEDTRIIIVEHIGFPIGIMVDGVEEVIRIPDENVQQIPEAAVTLASEEYLTGVGMLDDRLVVLLDVDRLLSRTEVSEVEATRRSNGKAAAPPAPDAVAGIRERPRTEGETLTKGTN
jgi:purine-binding chemotaxis protein CheW